MNVLLAGTLNEIQKVLSKKRYIAMFIIALSITLLVAILNELTNRNFGFYVLSGSNLPQTILKVISFIIMPLFIFMITTDLFSGENSDKSIITTLVRPISRHKVYLAKVLAVVAFLTIILTITFFVSNVAGLMESSLANVIDSLLTNIIVYVAAIVPMTMIIVITAFVAQFYKNNGSTIVTMILSFIVLYVLGFLFKYIGVLSPVTYINWYNNFATYNYNINTILSEFMFIISYVIIFLGSGIYLFNKKDI